MRRTNPGPLLDDKADGSLQTVPPSLLARVGHWIKHRKWPLDQVKPEVDGENVIESTIEQSQTNERLLKVTGFTDREKFVTDVKRTEEYGGAVVIQEMKLAQPGVPADSDYGVLTSEVIDMGNGQAYRVTARLPGGKEWPLLHGSEIDPEFGILIPTSRQFVPVNREGVIYYDPDTKICTGTEIQVSSDVRSIAVSRHIELPADIVRPIAANIPLPPVLAGGEIIGTETYRFRPIWQRGPLGAVKGRVITRFFPGSPTEDSFPPIQYWYSEPLLMLVEYTAKRSNVSYSSNDSASESRNTSLGFSDSRGKDIGFNAGKSTSSNSSLSHGLEAGNSISSNENSGTGINTSTNDSTSDSTSSGTNTNFSDSTSQTSGTNTTDSNSTSSGRNISDVESQSHSSSQSTGSNTSHSRSISKTYSDSITTTEGDSRNTDQHSESDSNGWNDSTSDTDSTTLKQNSTSISRNHTNSSNYSTHESYDKVEGSGTQLSQLVREGDLTYNPIESRSNQSEEQSKREGWSRTPSGWSDSNGVSINESFGDNKTHNFTHTDTKSHSASDSSSSGHNWSKQGSTSNGNNSSTTDTTGTSSSDTISDSMSTSHTLSITSGTNHSLTDSISSGNNRSVTNSNSTSNGTQHTVSRSTTTSSSTQSGNQTSTGNRSGESCSDTDSSSDNLTSSESKSKSQRLGGSNSVNLSVQWSVSKSTNDSLSVGLDLFEVSLPACLRPAIRLRNEVIDVTIPASNPASYPLGEWFAVGISQPRHWSAGVWVAEITEVFVDA